VDSGASLSADKPSDPARSEYTFGGWYTSTGGNGSLFTAETPVTADITVYAKWTIKQYTVTFDAGEGSPPTQTRTVDSGASLSALPSEQTRSGYTFDGWYTSTGGGGSLFTTETPVTADIRVYAKWTVKQYTVTFDAGEGIPPIQTWIVNSFDSVGLNMPSDPTSNVYAFGGWYTAAGGGGSLFTAETPVTADITVYANWVMPDDLSLNDTLTWIRNYAEEGDSYSITLKKDEAIAPRSLTYDGKTVRITIKGDTEDRTISSTAAGSLFVVESGVTLTLDANLTLNGRSGNTAAFIQVNSGGGLVMNAGSKIAGNAGGGMTINGGAFTLNDGTISDNAASGVNINDGTFTMNGGTINDNAASGVNINGGTFTMNGGTISGNTVSSAYSSYKGGGGVYISNNGAFTMNGGTISDNTVSSSSSYYSSSYNGGGGVYIYDGTFTMSGGTISGNTVSSSSSYTGGGGVYVYDGTFTMSSGTISGNTVSSSSSYSGGGGVYVYGNSGGLFIKKSNGIIYGSDGDSDLKNTANSGDSYGHAVYVSVSSGSRKRNATAGRWVTLDSSKSITDGGGWE
jgi:uncharacterized repeat protein (TIGR02543 family)